MIQYCLLSMSYAMNLVSPILSLNLLLGFELQNSLFCLKHCMLDCLKYGFLVTVVVLGFGAILFDVIST